MSQTLADVLPELSRAALAALLGLSSLAQHERSVTVRIRDLAFLVSLHPQSVWRGLKELRERGLIESMSSPRSRWQTWILFPHIGPEDLVPLLCSLSVPAGAVRALAHVVPAKAARSSRGKIRIPKKTPIGNNPDQEE